MKCLIYIISIISFVNGLTYSQEVNSADTTGTFIDSRDGHVYKWIKIGTQIWMAENLAYLPEVYSHFISSSPEKRYYVYGYDGEKVSEAKITENYTTYGVLYNWEAALTSCPTGWQLPEDVDWQNLEIFLGMDSNVFVYNIPGVQMSGAVGAKLKESGITHWISPNVGATNSSGFTGLPGGFNHKETGFIGIGYCGFFWTASQRKPNDSYVYNVWHHSLDFEHAGVYRNFSTSKGTAYSVRCLKD